MSSEDDARPATDAFWLFALLGSIFSSIAIVSLTQKMMDVGLAQTMQEIVDYYRHLVHPVMQWLLLTFFPNWHLSEWVKDSYALSFVGGFTIGRVIAYRSEDAAPSSLGRPFQAVGIGLITGATFLGLLVYLISIIYLGSVLGLWDEDDPNIRRVYSRVAVLLALAFFQVLAFFAINSQM